MLVAAEAHLAADVPDVFALVADLDRHHVLTDSAVDIVRLEGPVGRRSGGDVELRGPFRLRRRVRTRVGGAEFPSRLWGTAVTDGGSRARISWRLRPVEAGTAVRLEVEIVPGRADRLLLTLGGRLWLRRQLRVGLRRLAAAHACGGAPDVPASAPAPARP